MTKPSTPLAIVPQTPSRVEEVNGRRVAVYPGPDGGSRRRLLPVVKIVWAAPGLTRFQECLDILHLKRRIFGREINAGPSIVDDWARGNISVPAAIMEWLEATVAYRLANPPPGPEAWRRRGRGVGCPRAEPERVAA